MSSTSKKQSTNTHSRAAAKSSTALEREKQLRKLAEGVAAKHARTLDKLGR